jgi:hypothetical protein
MDQEAGDVGCDDGFVHDEIGHPLVEATAASLLNGSLTAATGGKFANGAATAAMSYAFNQLTHDHMFADGAEPVSRDVLFVPTDRDTIYPYDVYVAHNGALIAGPFHGSIFPDQTRANCGGGLCPTIASGAYSYQLAKSPGGWGRQGFMGLRLGDVPTRSPNLSLNARREGHYGQHLARGVSVHPGTERSTTSEACLTVRLRHYNDLISSFPRGATGTVWVLPDQTGWFYNLIRPRQFD